MARAAQRLLGLLSLGWKQSQRLRLLCSRGPSKRGKCPRDWVPEARGYSLPTTEEETPKGFGSSEVLKGARALRLPRLSAKSRYQFSALLSGVRGVTDLNDGRLWGAGVSRLRESGEASTHPSLMLPAKALWKRSPSTVGCRPLEI